ncbi:hypothetical protein ACC733_38975, partial [Rhizobium johnstonii]
YDDLYRDFSWRIPEDFNIGRAFSDDWAARDPERVFLEHFSPDGDHRVMTYRALADRYSASISSTPPTPIPMVHQRRS